MVIGGEACEGETRLALGIEICRKIDCNSYNLICWLVCNLHRVLEDESCMV